MTSLIADTCTIVALLDDSDSQHSYARECFSHWTIDSDFKIYRLNNRRVVPVLAP